MEIETILERVDRLYEEHKGEEAEGLLLGALSIAAEEQDGPAMLQLLNELLGYYRETGQAEKGIRAAEDAMELADRILPRESIPYATTLLNCATLFRTIGKLEDSLSIYRQVEEIYHQILQPDNLLTASLYNNESLLYQEMGDFPRAKRCLEKALDIVTEKGEVYEEAVSRANLAGTCIQLGELEEAYQQAMRSISLFEEQGVEDQHLCAAMSALGSYYYIKGQFAGAADTFHHAMEIMEKSLGRNGYYERLKENYESCRAALRKEKERENGDRKNDRGLAICRRYYEAFGAPMIREKFPEYEGKIAVGLAGEGSDCFGWDDAISRDHDWGPSFCMWLTEETYHAIGKQLQEAYEALPEEFEGYHRAPVAQGGGRRGVQTIRGFFHRLLQAEDYEHINWNQVSDATLAAAVNGEVFRDDEGIFTAERDKLKAGYPESARLVRLAQSCATFAQTAQYNYERMLARKDSLTASVMLADGLREAMKLAYYMENVYPPHDKWLRTGLSGLACGEEVEELLREMAEDPRKAEEVGAYFAMALYRMDDISDIDPYLDHQTEELLEKSVNCRKSTEDLVMEIAELEFAEFDKVRNVGGRADCQDDWPTFSIMRRSQYLTWDRTMLLQYLYDLHRESRMGHNLITEKYGRMMESTAPGEYEEIRDRFPELTDEKKAIIEQIVAVQVGWMEDFSARYPHMGQQARSVHTAQDNLYNTSYETYLRGEIGTYSDKMLELYARFIVGLAREGKNLAQLTMENSARLYGYRDLDHAEQFLGM